MLEGTNRVTRRIKRESATPTLHPGPGSSCLLDQGAVLSEDRMNNARDSFALRRADARTKTLESNLPFRDTLQAIINHMGQRTQYSCCWPSTAYLANKLRKSQRTIKYHIEAIKACNILIMTVLPPKQAATFITNNYPDAEPKFGKTHNKVAIYQPNPDHPIWSATKRLTQQQVSQMQLTTDQVWGRKKHQDNASEGHLNGAIVGKLNGAIDCTQSVKTFNSIEDDCSNLSHHWKGEAPNLKNAANAANAAGQGYAPQSRLANQPLETLTSRSNQPLETSAGQNFKREVLPFNRRELKSSEESRDTTQDLEFKERQERKQKHLEQVNNSPRYQEFLSLLSVACGPLNDSHRQKVQQAWLAGLSFHWEELLEMLAASDFFCGFIKCRTTEKPFQPTIGWLFGTFSHENKTQPRWEAILHKNGHALPPGQSLITKFTIPALGQTYQTTLAEQLQSRTELITKRLGSPFRQAILHRIARDLDSRIETEQLKQAAELQEVEATLPELPTPQPEPTTPEQPQDPKDELNELLANGGFTHRYE